MTKYIIIGLLVIIISLLVYLFFQYVSLAAIKVQNENLKIENKKLTNSIAFIEKSKEIEKSFTNSSEIIAKGGQSPNQEDEDIKSETKNTIDSITADYNNSMRLQDDSN